MKNLSYIYPSNSGKLSAVAKFRGNPQGFYIGNIVIDDFVYDQYGNMTSCNNHKIKLIISKTKESDTISIEIVADPINSL